MRGYSLLLRLSTAFTSPPMLRPDRGCISRHEQQADSRIERQKFLRRANSSFAARGVYRKFWLLAAALTPASLAGSEAALAQACGPLVGGSVTCTSSGNVYPGGISYSQTTANTDLSVTLNSDVNVVRTGPGGAVGALNEAGGAAVITANGATISTSGAAFDIGLTVNASGGNAIITSSGLIDISTAPFVVGIQSSVIGNGVPNAVASVTYNGPGIRVGGGESVGLLATNTAANGNSIIDASGDITGVVPTGQINLNAIFASTQGNGNASAHYRSGTINVQGNGATGVFAGADGTGSTEVITDPGTTIIIKGTNPGETSPTQPVKAAIVLQSPGGTAAGGASETVTAASTIQVLGKADPVASYFSNPIGIRVSATLDAPISVTYTGPGITVEGGGGAGIFAISGSGSIVSNSSGPITTNGLRSYGILVDSGTIRPTPTPQPPPAPPPALVLKPGGPITVTASGAITTQGVEGHGIWATSTTGTVQVNATNVSTTGQFSIGINAASSGINGTGGSDVTVNVTPGGSVMGGWQPGLTDKGNGTVYFGGLPAAGVILSSTGGTATLTNDGSIGALSDRAVAGNSQIINNGTITGFVQFGGANNSILNNGTFDLRHFADTNGDGVRDTFRVAIVGPRHWRKQQLHEQRNTGAPRSDRRDDARQHRAVSPAWATPQQRHVARWTGCRAIFSACPHSPTTGTINLQAIPPLATSC